MTSPAAPRRTRRPGLARRSGSRAGRVGLRTLLGVALAALVAVPAPALATGSSSESSTSSAPDRVQVTKVVEADADLDGTLREATLLTELEVRGDGTVEVVDPTVSGPVEPLTGFSGPRRVGDDAHWTLDVEGSRTVRAVADWDRPLPVAARTSFTVDGDRVDAGALGEADGPVTTATVLRNLTGQTVSLSWRDDGDVVTEDVEVPVPFVARVTATYDEGWEQVEAPDGFVRASGDGTTQATWVALLFEPLGDLETRLLARAAAAGEEPPEVTVEAAPVTVGDGAATEHVVGLLREGNVDASVLSFLLAEVEGGIDELADGLGELIEGLSQLADGTEGLAGGIGEAGDGADELAAGASELAGGAGEAAEGLGELASGAGQLAAGADELAGGVGELETATGGLAAGAAQLVPAAEGVAAGVGELADALAALPEPPDDLPIAELAALLDGGQAALGRLTAALEDGAQLEELLVDAGLRLEELEERAREEDGERAEELADRAAEVRALVDEARQAATAQHERLAAAAADAGAALEDLGALLAELDLDGPGPGQQLDGIAELAEGADLLAEGVAELAEGTDELAAGVGELGAGAAGLADGADELAAGAGEAATGAGGLAEGTQGLAGGIAGLADGLDEAEAGAEELAEAAAGVTEGAGGAQEGASQLGEFAGETTEAGEDAAGGTARDLALISAMDERVQDGDGVPVGVPEGAEATGAYRLALSHEEPATLDPRVPAAAALLAIGALVPGWARRRLAP